MPLSADVLRSCTAPLLTSITVLLGYLPKWTIHLSVQWGTTAILSMNYLCKYYCPFCQCHLQCSSHSGTNGFCATEFPTFSRDVALHFQKTISNPSSVPFFTLFVWLTCHFWSILRHDRLCAGDIQLRYNCRWYNLVCPSRMMCALAAIYFFLSSTFFRLCSNAVFFFSVV